MDFTYWNKLTEPEKFLENDWENPSRKWAGNKVAEAVAKGARTMVEIGPGNGVDFERQFKSIVMGGYLSYDGYEGSSTLCTTLQRRFPEGSFQNKTLLDLQPQSYDIVYARHVLEHQPSLEPNFSQLLAAAKEVAIIVWYRPPASVALHEVGAAGEHYHTYLRDDALNVVGRAGCKIVEEVTLPGDGNLGWVISSKARI